MTEGTASWRSNNSKPIKRSKPIPRKEIPSFWGSENFTSSKKYAIPQAKPKENP